jgi:hypothetical protein
MIVLRLVIDTPEETNDSNPNYNAGEWSPDFESVGNNVFVVKVEDGLLKLNTYSFGL